MNRISAELFEFIMAHLPLVDKLNCILVCKRWHEILISNGLYNTLVFNSEEKLDDGIAFFENNKNFGHHTRNLFLFGFPVEDPSTVVALMSLFPNVRNVKWEEQECISTEMWDYETLEKLSEVWVQLESLILPSSMIFANPLFTNTTQYIHLKHLDITVMVLSIWGHTESEAEERSHSILTLIGSSPNLETLIFQNGSMSLVELDRLHMVVPKLKRLELICMHITSSNSLEVELPAMNLVTFHLSIANIPRLYSSISVETKCRWLSYFGMKYKYVQDFTVTYSDAVGKNDMPMEDHEPGQGTDDQDQLLSESGSFKSPIHQSVVDSIMEMSNVSNYRSVFFCDIASYILDVLDTKKNLLKKIHLDIVQCKVLTFNTVTNDERRILSFLEPIVSSGQVNNIEQMLITLRVEIINQEEYSKLINGIIVCTDALKNLVHLTLQYFHQYKWTIQSLFFTLCNLSKLEQLTVEGLPINSTVLNDFPPEMNEGVLKSINTKNVKNNLKALTIKDFKLHASMRDINEKVNDFLHDVLKICSNLKSFSLSGEMKNRSSLMTGGAENGFNDEGVYVGDCLNLSLIDCTQLKSLAVGLKGFDYYVFNELAEKRGKCWHDYYHSATDVSGCEFGKFINLAWTGKLVSLNIPYLSPYGSTSMFFD